MTKILLIFLALTSLPLLQATEINKLIQDTRKLSQNAKQISMVWWIPQELWEANFEQDPTIPKEKKEELLKLLKKYSIFAVAEIDIGTTGSLTHKGRKEIRDYIKLETSTGTIEPIPFMVLNQDIYSLLRSMKSTLGQTMGEIGQGVEFFVYPNQIAGKTLLDPKSNDFFKFTSFGTEFKWRLPLGSLLPPVIDKETGEEFPGNYRYNPFNGNKL